MKRELLGTVSAPTGAVMLVDMGLLGLWSHHGLPAPEDVRETPEVSSLGDQARDFQVLGEDRLAASRLFGQTPGWLYDRPPGFEKEFQRKISERGLRATLHPQDQRIPHRQRLDNCLDGSPWGLVEFHGFWGLGFADIPTGETLEVLGVRMGVGDFPRCWDQVELSVRPLVEVSDTVKIGPIPVDRARLGFFDIDALGSWIHEAPLDSRADLVFWGRDASQAATAMEAGTLGDGQYGWRDLPIPDALTRAQELEVLKARQRWKLASDFRPHSHHHKMLEKIRSSPTESGTLKVGGARVCAFMTSWGDGFFPVEMDLGPGGELVSLRILLGNEGSVQNMMAVNA